MSRYVLHEGAPASHLSNRRSRDPARQGRALRRRQAAHGARVPRLSGSRSQALSAATSILSMPWRSTSFPIAISRRSRAPSTRLAQARIALLNLAARAEIETVRRIDKIETAIEPDFQRHFVAAMAFPNKEDAFPNLGRRIALPRARSRAGRAKAGRFARRSLTLS